MKTRFSICMLAPVHNADDSRVFKKEARSLAEHGYRVTLWARATACQEIDGVLVKPVKYKQRWQRFLLIPWLFYKALQENASIYHLHNPDNLPIGFALVLFGKHVIYDTHEDFSKKILQRQWLPLPLRKFAASVVSNGEVALSHITDATIVTQSVQLEQFEHSLLIRNAPTIDAIFLDNVARAATQIHKDEHLRLIYIGGISADRGLFKMLELLGELNRFTPTRLWLIGEFETQLELERARADTNWGLVDYLGYLPQEQAFGYLVCSDFGLILLLDVVDYRFTSPNKLFEYMLFGIPFVATRFHTWQEQVADTESGLFVPIEDVSEIAKQVIACYSDQTRYIEMSDNGKRYIRDHFNWEVEKQKLIDLYDHVIVTRGH